MLGWYMTDEEIAVLRRQRAAAEKAPLYQRLLEWPVCLLLYAAIGIAAPFLLIARWRE